MSKDVFHLTRQTINECSPDVHDREAMFKIIQIVIGGRISSTQKQNPSIIMKPYIVRSYNDLNIACLLVTIVNIDIELVEVFL